jgi:hypothetical protein
MVCPAAATTRLLSLATVLGTGTDTPSPESGGRGQGRGAVETAALKLPDAAADVNWAQCELCGQWRAEVSKPYTESDRFDCSMEQRHCDEPGDDSASEDEDGGESDKSELDDSGGRAALTPVEEDSCGI